MLCAAALLVMPASPSLSRPVASAAGTASLAAGSTGAPSGSGLAFPGTAVGMPAFTGDSAAAPAPASARSVSAILIDARDGRVLFAQGANLVRRPASLTKMMTLFLTFDALDADTLQLSDTIKFSRAAASQPPSRLGLRAGASITVGEAIRAIAVSSANDVAVALAEKLGGSEAGFARRMTAKAQTLGMHRTSFTNVTGLPGANLTTATDMALLSKALIDRHADRYAYFSTRSFRWAGRQLQNHNHLLGAVDGLDGIKTGYTVEAGFNLAASARRGNRRLIAVVLGERTARSRDKLVAQILERGFDERDGASG